MLCAAMAKNDVILIDGIVDQRVADGLPSAQRDEVFEFLVLEETLKDYDLSRDEIESGGRMARATAESMAFTLWLMVTCLMTQKTSSGPEATHRSMCGYLSASTSPRSTKHLLIRFSPRYRSCSTYRAMQANCMAPIPKSCSNLGSYSLLLIAAYR